MTPESSPTSRTKSLAAADRMGVYKRLEDVPDRFRFYHHADAYEGRDVWREFCEDYEYHQGDSAHFHQEVDRAGRVWHEFMCGRNRHHALATPADIEAWSGELLASKPSKRRAYEYWIRVERFYDWLQWHVDHPHVYTPALMAAAVSGAAGDIWAYKAAHHRNRREAYE